MAFKLIFASFQNTNYCIDLFTYKIIKLCTVSGNYSLRIRPSASINELIILNVRIGKAFGFWGWDSIWSECNIEGIRMIQEVAEHSIKLGKYNSEHEKGNLGP